MLLSVLFELFLLVHLLVDNLVDLLFVELLFEFDLVVEAVDFPFEFLERDFLHFDFRGESLVLGDKLPVAFQENFLFLFQGFDFQFEIAYFFVVLDLYCLHFVDEFGVSG